MLSTIRAWFSRQYWLALLPALAILLVSQFIPEYLPNESVRLTSLRQFAYPSFLSHEWLHIAGYNEDSLTIGFKALLAPLWFCTKDGILVAMAGRVIAGTVVFYAIIRLARALDIPRYALAVGLLLWICKNQSLGAGEYIFGAVEGKCFAYAWIMLSIESLLRKRLFRAALFCGLAFWFHVPVAVWGVLAVCGALLLCRRDYAPTQLLQFGLIIVGLCIPMAFMALKYTGKSGLVGAFPESDWLVVVFRNPHHLDPYFFGGWREFLKLSLCVGVAAAVLRTVSHPKWKLPSAFLLILLLEFMTGLVARKLGLFGYLKMYPFRVADTLILLLFCMVLPVIVVRLLSGSPNSSFSLMSSARKNAAFCLLVTAVIVADISRHPEMPHRFTNSWAQFLHHQESPGQEMDRWIRAYTPVERNIYRSPLDGGFLPGC